MKKLLLLVLILHSVSFPAQAKDFAWQGAQVQTVLGGAHDVIEETLFVYGQGTIFFVPNAKSYMYFAFVGVKWQVVDWFWFMPLVGYAGNWTSNPEIDDPQEAVDTALRIGFSFFEGMLEIYLEGEPIFNKDIVDYYGFYSIDYIPVDWFNTGIHVEQINKGIMFGPHIGFSKKPWSIQAQYFIGLQDDKKVAENNGHALRFFNQVVF